MYYILELLIVKRRISVAPTFSSRSIIFEDSFLSTSADTATPLRLELMYSNDE